MQSLFYHDITNKHNSTYNIFEHQPQHLVTRKASPWISTIHSIKTQGKTKQFAC